MLGYLRARAVDYAVVLSWAKQELKSLQIEHPEHQPLIARLQDSLDEAQHLLSQLQVIARIGHPRLVARALPIIHEIEFWTIIITYYYIPALRRENQEDLILRDILIPTATRCGLSWIEDIIVRLDGGHATVSVLTETPVVFAPPQHSSSLLDMAGLYHELGHTVFRRFPVIADHLSATVFGHYIDFRQKAGPMSPSKRVERDRVIGKALEYWDEKRLEETFCDIYATFVSGPVHFFSCVDMALRDDFDPFRIDLQDVHPPMAARVYVCDEALAAAHQNAQVVLSARDAWNTHINTLSRNAEFEVICASALLSRLTKTTIRDIQRFLPGAKHYNTLLVPVTDGSQVLQSRPLEDVLNIAAQMLLTSPDQYANWQEKALKALAS